MPDGDPWDWTINNVTSWVLNDLPNPTNGPLNVQLPDLVQLSANFRKAKVSGFVLLSDVNHDFLHHGCGVSDLGCRSPILLAIRRLQRESIGYCAENQLPAPILKAASSTTRVSTPPVPSSTGPSKATAPARCRAGEHLVEDENGRKRRKLTLATVPAHRRAGEHLVEDENGRKRRKLTLATTGPTTQDKDVPAPTPQPPPSHKTFLPDAKLTLDDIIYGQIALGEATARDSESDEFSFISNKEHQGDRLHVQRQMRYLYRPSARSLPPNRIDVTRAALTSSITRDGKKYTTFTPYDNRYVLPGTQPSFILFEGLDHDDPAIRTTRGALDETTDNSEHGSWDFLLDKYKPGEVLPEYGESGNGDEIDSQLAAELEEEEEELNGLQSSRKTLITETEAASIFDDVMQDFRDNWTTKQQPKLEAKEAYKIWRSVRHSGAVRKAIEAANRNKVVGLEKRLAVLRRDILEHTWQREDDLVRICEPCQPTVEDIQELLWQRSVWSRPVAPPRPRREAPQTRNNEAMPAARYGLSVEPDDLNGFVIGSNEQEDIEMPLASNGLLEDGSQENDVASDSPKPLLQSLDADAVDSEMPDGPTHSDPDVGHLHASAHSKNSSPTINLLSSPPSEHSLTRSKSMPDLIEISDDDAEESKPKIKEEKTTKKIPDLRQLPEDASRADIESWDLNWLKETRDRKRILSKIFLMLDEEHKQTLADTLSRQKQPWEWLVEQTTLILDQKAGRPNELPHVNAPEFAKLYACWYQCDPEYWDYVLPQSLYEEINRSDMKAWAKYTAIVVPRIANFIAPGDIVDLSSDEEEYNTKTKAKPKSKPMDMVAAASRDKAMQRMQMARESQRSTDQAALHQMDVSSDDFQDEITINTLREKEEAPVTLHPMLAMRLKPHQIEGVRFLWREVMAEGKDGCILAHTMGLGKTCQAISFLVTLKEAAERGETRKQVPKDLRSVRALVLCPASVLPNWLREFEMWSPRKGFFKLFKIDASGNDQHERLDVLKSWSETERGGILVMGYNMFQRLMLPKEPADPNGKTDNEATSAEVTEIDNTATEDNANPSTHNKLSKQERSLAVKILREKAGIIVADEAHALRNEKSKVSMAASKLKGIRIALSGTPLSNATREIFSLVNWVAPNYLGSKAEFEREFAKPIEEGTYSDSTWHQRRKSMKKLAILRNQTEPKIDRQDITALRDFLTAKTEYNLTVPLTKLQKDVYEKYIGFITGTVGDRDVETIDLWGWISLLVLLVTHPKALRTKLLEAPRKEKKTKGKSSNTAETSCAADDDSDQSVIGDEHVLKLGLQPYMIDELVALIPEKADVSASYRMVLIKQILQLAKAANDKTLIFSHRLQLLDCLAELLDEMKIKWGRIDGSMPTPKREAVLVDFRQGRFDVLLISTRAGGQGLNMQDANRVIIVDFGFNPTWEEQAVGRAYRLGQKKNVYVYRFVSGGTFEDRLYNMGMFKSSLFQRVVDKKNPERHAKRDMREWIFPPKPIEQGDIDEEDVKKDKQVLEKIISMQVKGGKDFFIRGIKTMETLQRDAEDDPLDAEEQAEIEAEVNRMRQVRNNPSAAFRAVPPSTALGWVAPDSLATAVPDSAPMPSSTAPPAMASNALDATVPSSPPPIRHSRYSKYSIAERSPPRTAAPPAELSLAHIQNSRIASRVNDPFRFSSPASSATASGSKNGLSRAAEQYPSFGPLRSKQRTISSTLPAANTRLASLANGRKSPPPTV